MIESKDMESRSQSSHSLQNRISDLQSSFYLNHILLSHRNGIQDGLFSTATARVVE